MNTPEIGTRVSSEYTAPSQRVSPLPRADAVAGDAPTETGTGQKRDLFLIALNDRLRPLRDPVEIQREAVRVLGEHLDAAWVHYVDIGTDHSFATIITEYLAPGLSSLAGRRSSAGVERVLGALSAGRIVVVNDIRSSPLVDAGRAADFLGAGATGFVAVPIVKDGQLIGAVSAAGRVPHAWTREEILLVEETAGRTWAAVDRARAEREMEIELCNTRLLQDLSAELVTEADADAFFDAILAAAIAITNAAAGTIRLLDTDRNELVLLTTRGLDGTLASHLRRVHIHSHTSPGRAFATRERTFVDFESDTDIEADRQSRRLHVVAGLLSAQTTPLVTRDGRALGTLTTHWRERRRPCERELRFLDLLARQAADLIERRFADEALRQSEQRLSAELADLQLLQSLSAELIRDEDSTRLYHTLVDAASSIMRSDFAVLQVLQPVRGACSELRLLASSGFPQEVIDAWDTIPHDAKTTCGLAARTNSRVVARDITLPKVDLGDDERATYLAIGVRAAQTTPLVSRGGQTVGMISTFWSDIHQPSDRDLRLLDIVARQAADLIERAQAAEALRKREAELEEADRRKDEFLAVLAHELRNPLAPIRTSLEVMRFAGNAPEVLDESRAIMERQVGHMVRLIDDLLDVSRIASGKIHLQRAPTLLRSLVNTAIETNRALLAAGRVLLEIDVPDEPILLDVDATRFIQILANVLHNAVKFSQPGDRVTVVVTLERAADGGREARFVVTDSGAGIAPELLPRVFELFTQDSESAKGTGPGLGIGLALARQLIEMHGGSIEARSDGPGMGSTFTIRLPLPAEIATGPTPTSERETPRIARRVTIIDDNVDAADAMQRLLTLMGGDCRVAYGGESGLAEVLAFRPDVVFLDIGMPGMDGYEVCRRIRRELGNSVLVVALTGWGQDRNKQQSSDAGFDVHLTKPANPLDLEKILTGERS